MHPTPTNLWLDSGLQRLKRMWSFHIFGKTTEYLSGNWSKYFLLKAEHDQGCEVTVALYF